MSNHLDGIPQSSLSRQAILAMAGDDQALADLYVRCHEVLLVRAARIAPRLDPAELEDVVSDSLLTVIRVLRNGRWDPHQGPFLAWLDRVVRNDLIDATRGRARRANLIDGRELDRLRSPLTTGPATRLAAAEQEAHIVASVRRKLGAIHQRYADVLLLRSILRLDVDAIADELGMQRRQVIDACYEGKRQLLARLERGAADWDVFLRHVELRVGADTPAAVRALARSPAAE